MLLLWYIEHTKKTSAKKERISFSCANLGAENVSAGSVRRNVIYPISWRFCAIKCVAISLRRAMSRLAFLHNLSLRLNLIYSDETDGLNFSDNMAYISEKWLMKLRRFFLT